MTRPRSFICATRAWKNIRHLQTVHILPSVEPAEGFTSIIPLATLAQVHRPEWRAQSVDKKLAVLLDGVDFPPVSNAAVDPLFKGTLYFVRIQFTIQDQGNVVLSVSDADVATALTYANQAARPISRYAGQYGPNGIAVSQNVLALSVTLPTAKYTDAALRSWVNTVVLNYNLPGNTCVVVLNPPGLLNTTYPGAGGYHGYANGPYISSNVYGQDLTVADKPRVYAQILSHEIAEMVVDPRVDGANPEVCDPCGPNCQRVFLDYFDGGGYYLGTSQSFPPAFAYGFYINGIVQPAYAGQCVPPPPAVGCDYVPPGWSSLVGHDLQQIVVGQNADGRLELFALGGDRAVYHIWQTAPNGNWGDWASLAGHDLQQIVVGQNADGRLEVFALGGDRAVYHIWQTAPNGNWGDWANLSGTQLQQIIVGSNEDGRLEAFALDAGGVLYHASQIQPNGGWS